MNNTAVELSNTVNDFITRYSSQINWMQRTASEKWAAIEILGHLTDSAVVNLHRFVRCTYESDFTLTYAQDEWVIAQHYKDADVNELLTLWQLLNKQIISVLNNYPPQSWQAKCNDQTVEFLAADYVDHMRHHLDQIIALL
ncbi:DinB family protein [Mucilaginibacter sp. HD30]